MDAPRQLQFMYMFHPDHGDMGLYVNAFVEEMLQNGLAQRTLEDVVLSGKVKSWHLYDKQDQKPELIRPTTGKLIKQARNAFEYGAIECDPMAATFILQSPGRQLFHDVRTLSYFAIDKVFPNYSRLKDGMPKDDTIKKFQMNFSSCPSAHFRKLASEEFAAANMNLYEGFGDFVQSPKTVFMEGTNTMNQAMTWLCMHCESPEQIMRQMSAALEPTIQDPRRGRMISPIEMLGYGNNGYIGEVLASDVPALINREPIIRNASDDDPSIIHPDFVLSWFDRELHIGGCPALVHRARAGEVYMEFAKLFVELAKMVANEKDILLERKLARGAKFQNPSKD